MARPVVLGLDARMYMMLPANRNVTGNPSTDIPRVWDGVGGFGAGDHLESGNLDLIKPIREVTLSQTTRTTEVTTRASGGTAQFVGTLSERSIDFNVLWLPDDPIFLALQTYFETKCPGTFAVLDGPKEGLTVADARCGALGNVTGLFADFLVTNFTRNEGLEEGVMADVSLMVALGAIIPEWVVIPPPPPPP